MDYNKLTVVLYSWEQKCYHIETMGEYIESNKRANINKKNHQYRLIYVCENYYDALKFTKE